MNATEGYAIVDKKYSHLDKHNWFTTWNGYAMAYIDGKRIRLHRLITAAQKGEYIDHINRDRLDNREENLRSATYQQNLINKPKQANNTSGYKGVFYRKDTNKWFAKIVKEGKQHHLGTYESKTDAAKAYNEKALELFGEFAYTNKLQKPLGS